MSIIKLTDENFENEVLNSGKPVLIDFYADWCAPCRAVSPIVDSLADEISDKKICKVNVDEQPALASRYSVYSIPTLVLIKNGEVAHTSVGAVSKKAILDMLEK